MQSNEVDGLITEERCAAWVRHYKGLLAFALHTRHPCAVEECEEHIAMATMALQSIRERRNAKFARS